jgi:hypothetical protein
LRNAGAGQWIRSATAEIDRTMPRADRSPFDQVLDAVSRAAKSETGESTAAAYRGRIVLECLLEQAEHAALPSTDALAELYVEGVPHLPPGPVHFAAVAEELGLRPGLTPAELGRIRRSFALANHPDRAAPAHRDEATRRMAIANILIDRALREIRHRIDRRSFEQVLPIA